ncbi:MAG: hypothetical protein GXC73_18610 [Chitinophagaceae bacterium]|nr:hypothetical protein [Chitinophagaceae bacterium]
MQSKLYTLSLFAFLFFTLSSCRKWLPENRIEGSWQLTELQKRRAFNNENVATEYRSGTFTFFEDRTARYTDGNGTMQGSWEIRSVSHTYTDSDGNRKSETKNILWIKLYDFSSNRVIDWYFDRFDFRNSGQRLFAFMDGSGYDYRYCFSKR